MWEEEEEKRALSIITVKGEKFPSIHVGSPAQPLFCSVIPLGGGQVSAAEPLLPRLDQRPSAFISAAAACRLTSARRDAGNGDNGKHFFPLGLFMGARFAQGPPPGMCRRGSVHIKDIKDIIKA